MSGSRMIGVRLSVVRTDFWTQQEERYDKAVKGKRDEQGKTQLQRSVQTGNGVGRHPGREKHCPNLPRAGDQRQSVLQVARSVHEPSLEYLRGQAQPRGK